MASGLYLLIFDAVYGSRTLSLLLCTLDAIKWFIFCNCVASTTFGNLTIGFENGKKEDRKGNSGSSTLGEFLKVIIVLH